MALVRSVKGMDPKMGKDCWLAETAVVAGDVVMGDNCSVWYGAVIRGDVNSIKIGDRTNVQDNAVIHCTYQKHETVIGNDVTIGHGAVVHGCELKDKVLIGMNSVVMDGAVVESGSVIAAGAIVLAGTQVEPGCVYAGIPAKKVKKLSEEEIANMAKVSGRYLEYVKWY
ncbi:gamma carbonic anhydrase family protein [Fulvitalea axinellae]|uniref:Gamma carbonic anhydrase family protein n=1 Tax=Fulvitalea axinellae TaxID=1182444 RepID=A0AAU9CP48_9BACT|nr:gamma carbonic anhydrase family protein [Fulvitalea axinellae]